MLNEIIPGPAWHTIIRAHSSTSSTFLPPRISPYMLLPVHAHSKMRVSVTFCCKLSSPPISVTQYQMIFRGLPAHLACWFHRGYGLISLTSPSICQCNDIDCQCWWSCDPFLLFLLRLLEMGYTLLKFCFIIYSVCSVTTVMDELHLYAYSDVNTARCQCSRYHYRTSLDGHANIIFVSQMSWCKFTILPTVYQYLTGHDGRLASSTDMGYSY